MSKDKINHHLDVRKKQLQTHITHNQTVMEAIVIMKQNEKCIFRRKQNEVSKSEGPQTMCNRVPQRWTRNNETLLTIFYDFIIFIC